MMIFLHYIWQLSTGRTVKKARTEIKSLASNPLPKLYKAGVFLCLNHTRRWYMLGAANSALSYPCQPPWLKPCCCWHGWSQIALLGFREGCQPGCDPPRQNPLSIHFLIVAVRVCCCLGHWFSKAFMHVFNWKPYGLQHLLSCFAQPQPEKSSGSREREREKKPSGFIYYLFQNDVCSCLDITDLKLQG